MPAYSLADVKASITGPGGSFEIGAGVGLATEGINVEPTGDVNTMTEGGDGEIMHSLRASKAGTITLTLLKTSPTNSKLMNMFIFQTSSSRFHGQNIIVINNPVSGDLHSGTQMAYKAKPGMPYAEEAGNIVWTFEGKIFSKLGSNTLR